MDQPSKTCLVVVRHLKLDIHDGIGAFCENSILDQHLSEVFMNATSVVVRVILFLADDVCSPTYPILVG
jgi:hypothetical protein